MSIVNATLIVSDTILSSNISVGNSTSNISINSNATAFFVGSNVVINTSAISVGNSTINTVINSTAISAANITINSVTISKIPSNTIVDYKVFTTTGWQTWTKPTWAQANDLVTIMAWGGGGGGAANSTVSASGGGGACVIASILAGQCNAVCNVFVGTGGASRVNQPGVNATAGANSVFWSNSTFSITAYGGGAGFANATASAGGSGGGWFGVGTPFGSGGAPLGGDPTTSRESTFGGGGPANTTGGTNGGISVYGGGGGGSSTGQGGNTIYGGGGGGGRSGNIGISVFGGNGGNSSINAAAPGGGGAYISTGTGSDGARGEVRVWVTKMVN